MIVPCLALGLLLAIGVPLYQCLGILLLGLLYMFSKPHWEQRYYKNQGIPKLECDTFLPDQYFELTKQKEIGKTYGDTLSRIIGPFHVIYLLSPTMLKDLVQKQTSFKKNSLVTDGARLLLGDGLLFAEGDSWRHQRTILNKAFSHEKLVKMSSLIEEMCNRNLNEWKTKIAAEANKKISIDFQKEIMKITSDVIGATIFGPDYSSTKLQDNDDDLVTLFKTSIQKLMACFENPITLLNMKLIFNYSPQKNPREYRKYCSRVRNLGKSLIAKRIREYQEDPAVLSKKSDLLSLMMQASLDEKHNGNHHNFTREDRDFFLDSCITFMIGGTETTACLVTFLFYCLSQNPDVEKYLRKEVEGVFKQKFEADPDNFIDFNALNQLPYMEKVILEVLRLYPPAPSIPFRKALIDVQIGDIQVKKGTLLGVSPFLIHRNPFYWKDPYSFNPERPEIDKYQGTAFLPFWSGKRSCIGQFLAKLEAKIIISKILLQFRVECHADKEKDPPLRSRFVLEIDGGLDAKVSMR